MRSFNQTEATFRHTVKYTRWERPERAEQRILGASVGHSRPHRRKLAPTRIRLGRCNRREFDGCLSEIAKGPSHTVAVFGNLGHPIAATRIDAGVSMKFDESMRFFSSPRTQRQITLNTGHKT
jgi:hypothetical protein